MEVRPEAILELVTKFSAVVLKAYVALFCYLLCFLSLLTEEVGDKYTLLYSDADFGYMLYALCVQPLTPVQALKF